MVRVTAGALRHRDGEVVRSLALERERFLLELRPRLRHLRQTGVDNQPDVLERVRSAVEPAAVRERIERVLGELLLERLRREQRQDEAVGRQVAGPVVRGDDDVRRGLGLDRLQVVADVPERVEDDVDIHSSPRAPR